MSSENHEIHKIGLALSGGGVRAAAFHCGVLKFLAEIGLLERIGHISTVSGGSLFAGLVFHCSGLRWPTSANYQEGVFRQIREILTSKSLQSDVTRRFLSPRNWLFLTSRANVLAKSMESLWGINSKLRDLPNTPLWSINGTTGETGKRFRIKGTTMGDYDLGYAECGNLKIASAMAMSAAFPGLIGPLRLKTTGYSWMKRECWDSNDPPNEVTLPFQHLCLYDGGVYDNLGLEPLFDVGRQEIKEHQVEMIIVSDASSPLTKGKIPGPLNWRRFKHLSDIITEQIRFLRIRAFFNFIQHHHSSGMYLQIGNDAKCKIVEFSQNIGKHSRSKDLLNCDWMMLQDTERASSYPTDLRKMNKDDFDLISRNGYETAKWNWALFVQM